MTEKEKLLEEKQQTEAKLRKAKNDLKALEAEEKQLLRRQRSHRIFTRGGMLETTVFSVARIGFFVPSR